LSEGITVPFFIGTKGTYEKQAEFMSATLPTEITSVACVFATNDNGTQFVEPPQSTASVDAVTYSVRVDECKNARSNTTLIHFAEEDVGFFGHYRIQVDDMVCLNHDHDLVSHKCSAAQHDRFRLSCV
jgi:hypothetical protein